uniref:Uncharacterized protein n=1 Tax=Rhizophora mucronata TaxID=61149 RepID=A0A2P2R0K4_RHIMU
MQFSSCALFAEHWKSLTTLWKVREIELSSEHIIKMLSHLISSRLTGPIGV